MSLVPLAATAVAAWLTADFLSGVFHWMEDAYGGPFWPIFGRHVTRPNLLHHYAPRAFLSNSWFTSSRLLLAICTLLALLTWAAGLFTWPVGLVLVLGLNANQVHKWSHRAPRENPAVVRWLQRLRLIQTPPHHHRHHVHERNSNYCVLTDFLNPVLDGLGFWRGVEWLIAHLTGVTRRDDATMAAIVLARDPGCFGEYLPMVRQRVQAELAASSDAPAPLAPAAGHA